MLVCDLTPLRSVALKVIVRAPGVAKLQGTVSEVPSGPSTSEVQASSSEVPSSGSLASPVSAKLWPTAQVVPLAGVRTSGQ
jgi:hypothetical protein